MYNMIAKEEKFWKEKSEWYDFPLTFWEVVEKLNWKENQNYKELREKFHKICNNNSYIIEYFRETLNSYVKILKHEIFDYEVKEIGRRATFKFFDGGDDSFDDLCCHIVGMGKEATFEVLNKPELASKYFNSYKESFRYCL